MNEIFVEDEKDFSLCVGRRGLTSHAGRQQRTPPTTALCHCVLRHILPLIYPPNTQQLGCRIDSQQLRKQPFLIRAAHNRELLGVEGLAIHLTQGTFISEQAATIRQWKGTIRKLALKRLDHSAHNRGVEVAQLRARPLEGSCELVPIRIWDLQILKEAQLLQHSRVCLVAQLGEARRRIFNANLNALRYSAAKTVDGSQHLLTVPAPLVVW